MMLSYSRDPFCCFTTSVALTTFWDRRRRAFAHVGGGPKTIVHDRTKTVVRRCLVTQPAPTYHPGRSIAGNLGGALPTSATQLRLSSWGAVCC